MTSELASPNREAEKASPMPLSGTARPFFNSSNITEASPPPRMERITEPTAERVSIRPQKVPSRPSRIRMPAM
ncbi:hypothetical protein MPOCJGCO_4547 [Methylobacterium trifolii]|uniref:Uncharacterized protein n=1 Tax=Methylobacterium trifolii TaxID=1003092 RepID=A0ABQ4U4Q0_9HYPH|nr:hypothetical protein MPOCJGCO_4547 [Methylobacterium trifolii]